MKIALIVGVSEYGRITSLPSCKRDAEAIESLLDETQDFEHRLCLSGALPAQTTKAQILSFLDKFRGQSVSQAIFYFSGHGTIQDGDLLYLLSDFDEERPRQTSLENKEIDNWLRDLGPEVAIKITDCCHSGMPYVKDGNSVESAIARSKGQFSACYFLAASQSDEVTYAGDTFSEFTEHILRGLSQRPQGTIRYKDLADTVLDSYKANSSQRPYIVQQGGMRDVFFEQTDETLALLKKLVTPEPAPQPEPTFEEPLVRRSLREAIEEEVKGMITSKTAEACLSAIKQAIDSFRVDEELKEVYELRNNFSNAWEAGIANEEAIGKWLKRHGDNIFGEAIVEEVKTKVPYHLLNPMEANIYPWGKIDSKREITGIRVTADMEYDFIRSSLEPKYHNLSKYESAFLLLWSWHEAVLFSYITPLRPTSWNQHQEPDQIGWKVSRFSSSKLAGAEALIIGTLRQMEKLARETLHQRFLST